MNSTVHFKNSQENEASASFSFSYEEKTVDPQKLLVKLRSYLQDILRSSHSSQEKLEILNKPSRWNFACPYCGDSSDARKKRGNIYTDKLYFKCYNCGKYRDLYGFMKDFSKRLDAEEMVYIRETESAGKKNIEFDPFYLFDRELVRKIAVERSEIEEKLGLVRAKDSRIKHYLEKRFQPNLETFSWNQKREQLYIFHCVPGTDKILGFQIRNFKNTPKYMTFQLGKVYDVLEKERVEGIEDLEEISTMFGVLEADFRNPITVFEGPLDSFLYPNSVATCSSNIDFPIDLSSLRYLYDYDAAGREAAMQKLKEGKTVFLWKKFFQAAGMHDPKKKMDLTDLVVFSRSKNFRLPKLGEYFSQDKYDAYWI